MTSGYEPPRLELALVLGRYLDDSSRCVNARQESSGLYLTKDDRDDWKGVELLGACRQGDRAPLC